MSSSSTADCGWFTECQFPWRVKLCLVWSLLMSVAWLVLLSTISLLLQSPLQPVSAVLQAVSPSPLYLGLMGAVVSWSSLSHAVTFSVSRHKPKSLAASLYAGLCPRVLLSISSHSLQTFVLCWCFKRLVWPDLADEDGFLRLSSLVTGVYLGAEYNLRSGNSLKFPVINKERSSQLRGVLSVRELSRCLVRSVKILQYCVLLASLHSLCLHLRLPDIFSPSLVAASLTTLTLVLASHRSTLAVSSVLLTAPLDTTEPALLLPALSSTSPLLSLLSLQMVTSLARVSPQLRSHVFSLSQPGGHPTAWRLVCSVCLGNISSLLPTKKEDRPAPVAAPVTQRVITSPTMRPLAGTGGAKLQDLVTSGDSAPAPRILSLAASLDKLKNLGGEEPLNKADNVLAITASIDLLSQLVCYSLTEDKFGVVQRDLNNIITSLCQLDLEVANKKVQQELHDAATVKHAVKSGLYRIAIKFGPHIGDIGLPSNISAKLKNYSKMLEC